MRMYFHGFADTWTPQQQDALNRLRVNSQQAADIARAAAAMADQKRREFDATIAAAEATQQAVIAAAGRQLWYRQEKEAEFATAQVAVSSADAAWRAAATTAQAADVTARSIAAQYQMLYSQSPAGVAEREAAMRAVADAAARAAAQAEAVRQAEIARQQAEIVAAQQAAQRAKTIKVALGGLGVLVAAFLLLRR